MKSIKLTDEQINYLIGDNIDKKILDKYQKELLKIQSSLNQCLESINSLLNNDIKEPKKLTIIDTDKLKELIADGKSVKEIAIILDRSEGSIRQKLTKLGIKLRK